MHEYSAVSAATAAALAEVLNAQASDGWQVIGVTSSGSDVSALLAREAAWSPVTAAPAAAADPVVEPAPAPAPAPAVTPEPPVMPMAEITPEPAVAAAAPVAEPAGWAVAPEPANATPPAADPNPMPMAPIGGGAAATVFEPTATYSAVAASPNAPVAAAPAVPAGWYADPAARFELRYWDGSTWTEHVSRAGQQFTDPPVA